MPNVLGENYGLVDLLWDSQNTSIAQRSLVPELQLIYWPENVAVPLNSEAVEFVSSPGDTKSLQRKEDIVRTEVPGE